MDSRAVHIGASEMRGHHTYFGKTTVVNDVPGSEARGHENRRRARGANVAGCVAPAAVARESTSESGRLAAANQNHPPPRRVGVGVDPLR